MSKSSFGFVAVTALFLSGCLGALGIGAGVEGVSFLNKKSFSEDSITVTFTTSADTAAMIVKQIVDDSAHRFLEERADSTDHSEDFYIRDFVIDSGAERKFKRSCFLHIPIVCKSKKDPKTHRDSSYLKFYSDTVIRGYVHIAVFSQGADRTKIAFMPYRVPNLILTPAKDFSSGMTRMDFYRLFLIAARNRGIECLECAAREESL